MGKGLAEKKGGKQLYGRYWPLYYLRADKLPVLPLDGGSIEIPLPFGGKARITSFWRAHGDIEAFLPDGRYMYYLVAP